MYIYHGASCNQWLLLLALHEEEDDNNNPEWFYTLLDEEGCHCTAGLSGFDTPFCCSNCLSRKQAITMNKVSY
jgi:hypothetical protein